MSGRKRACRADIKIICPTAGRVNTIEPIAQSNTSTASVNTPESGSMLSAGATALPGPSNARNINLPEISSIQLAPASSHIRVMKKPPVSPNGKDKHKGKVHSPTKAISKVVAGMSKDSAYYRDPGSEVSSDPGGTESSAQPRYGTRSLHPHADELEMQSLHLACVGETRAVREGTIPKKKSASRKEGTVKAPDLLSNLREDCLMQGARQGEKPNYLVIRTRIAQLEKYLLEMYHALRDTDCVDYKKKITDTEASISELKKVLKTIEQ